MIGVSLLCQREKPQNQTPTTKMTIYINQTAIFLHVTGGVRAIFDDEEIYCFGEFISAQDFNHDEFLLVDSDLIEGINFAGNNYYQRELTENIYETFGYLIP